MVRLILQLLGLLALIVAPLPAAAIAPPAAAAAAATTEHCAETEAGADQEKEEPLQDEAKHPCCKGSGGSCCPVGASFANPASAHIGDQENAARRASADLVPPGSAVPPLTEPPTLA